MPKSTQPIKVSSQEDKDYNAIDENTLENMVEYYVGCGYKVVSRTDTSAQLVREKHFSCLLATFLFLFLAIPFFIYLFWYMQKGDYKIYIRLINFDDPNLHALKITNDKGQEWVYEFDPTKSKRNIKIAKSKGLPSLAKAIIIFIVISFFVLVIIGILASQ